MKYIQIPVSPESKKKLDKYLKELSEATGNRRVYLKELGNYWIDKELNSKAYKRLIKR